MSHGGNNIETSLIIKGTQSILAEMKATIAESFTIDPRGRKTITSPTCAFHYGSPSFAGPRSSSTINLARQKELAGDPGEGEERVIATGRETQALSKLSRTSEILGCVNQSSWSRNEASLKLSDP